MKDKQFYLKTGFVMAAIVIVLFFVKIWIVDPFATIKSGSIMRYNQEQPQGPGAVEEHRNFSKEKVKISWRDSAKYVDQYVVTEGEIVSGYNNGTVCYLNFDKNYKQYLTLVIFSTKFSRFPDKPEKYYLGKTVRIEGRIKDYKGRQEIILGGQESITVIR
jgi:hypothetical protein